MITVPINTAIKVDNNSYNFKDVVTMLGCKGNSNYAEEMYRKLRYLYKAHRGMLYGSMHPDETYLDCSDIIPLSFVMNGCINLGKL